MMSFKVVLAFIMVTAANASNATSSVSSVTWTSASRSTSLVSGAYGGNLVVSFTPATAVPIAGTVTITPSAKLFTKDATTMCTMTSGPAVFASVKACVNTAGTAKSLVDECYCGSDAVVTPKYMYCYVNAKTVVGTDKAGRVTAADQRVCTGVDGTTKATAQCYCGTNNLVTAVNKFCFANDLITVGGVLGGGRIMDTPMCSDPTGVTSTSVRCSCGSDKVDTAIHKFCKENADKTGLVSASGPTCPNGEKIGTTAASTQCYCGSNAVVTAIGKFCFTKGDGTGLVTDAAQPTCPNSQKDGTTQASAQCYCGSDAVVTATGGKFCFTKADGKGLVTTVAHPVCPSTDGTTPVSNPGLCYCGTDALVAVSSGSTSSFCNVDQDAKGVVSDRIACPTAQRDGTTKAAAACSCGTDKVATAIGKFCYTKADGKGLVTDATQPVCPSTDGSTKAAAQCYCGTGALVTAVNKFCNTGGSAVGIISDTHACTGTEATGTTSASSRCSCGTDKVDTAAHRFCYTNAVFKTGLVSVATKLPPVQVSPITMHGVLTVMLIEPLGTGAAVLTCTNNLKVNGASGAVTFGIVTSSDTTALTAQTGYTVTVGPVVAAASTTAVSMLSAFCLSVVALRQ